VLGKVTSCQPGHGQPPKLESSHLAFLEPPSPQTNSSPPHPAFLSVTNFCFMGGHAFQALLGAKAVFPRMPPDVYRKLRASCIEALQHHFNFVRVPPEDPEKPDFGDLDIMAFDPIAHEMPSSEELRVALGADHVITSGQSRNFALRAEGSPSGLEGVDCGDPRHYHQVDLTVLKTQSLWDSLLLHHSYGDLGLILTLLCKPYGLAYSQGGVKVGGNRSSQYRV
jgi:hypothetical protein